MTDNLKPVRCGCGGEAEIIKHTYHKLSPSYGIECTNCHTESWQFYNSEAEAITAWNRAMGGTKDNDIPSVEPERKKGEWIFHIDDLFPEESTQECSVCHAEESIKIQNDNFCSNCGADMGGKQ